MLDTITTASKIPATRQSPAPRNTFKDLIKATGPKISHMNVGSIPNKIDTLKCDNADLKIISVSGTWLIASHDDQYYSLNNYKLVGDEQRYQK